MTESWSQPGVQPNRSAPPGVVIPVLNYPDVRAAVEWLCRAFGLVERLRIGDHRAQLLFGESCVVVGDGPRPIGAADLDGHLILLRVADADGHHANAARHGARILLPPTDYPYGERQYTAFDPGGHRWTFSQSVADMEPSAWGGILVGRPGGA